jgi:hypothetical protein
MKIVYILFILVLIPVVLAGVTLSCDTDQECELYTGDSTYTCINSKCSQALEEEQSQRLHEYFDMKDNQVDWNFGTVDKQELDPSSCLADECLNFAPVYNAPLDGFFRWLFYAR